jgi:hypothetical protein
MADPIRNPVRVRARRSSRWTGWPFVVVVFLLLWMDTAVATKCKTPERAPTAEEREQLAEFYRQREAALAALSAALHADPVLGPQLGGLKRVGWHYFDPLAQEPDPDASTDEALRLAGQDELLALVLLQSREDLGAAQRRQIIARWQDRGLPWTVLAAGPVDLSNAADRARYIDVLQQSLALPLNNALAVRVRELGMRYFELEERHREPQLSAALRAVSGTCMDWRWAVRSGIAALTLEATTIGLRGELIEDMCNPPDIELEAICARWAAKLRTESFVDWVQSLDPELSEPLWGAFSDCGPVTLLRTVQAHHGDWPQVAARLRNCKPAPTAESED